MLKCLQKRGTHMHIRQKALSDFFLRVLSFWKANENCIHTLQKNA